MNNVTQTNTSSTTGDSEASKGHVYTQEELRKMYGLPKRGWNSYFGHPEKELPQPKSPTEGREE